MKKIIDADKLVSCVIREHDVVIDVDDLLDAIENLSVDAVEVKHGRWIETDDGWDGTYYVCSECGCPWTLIDGTPEDNGMHYCPNCGVRMDGGKSDERPD